MPSHFGNWMKQERKKIQERNKRIERMLKYDDLGKTINYELKKEVKMLRNLGCLNYTAQQETLKPSNNNYERNEKEDMKLAMEYLYEFNEKLNKLHPMCKDLIHHVLQDRRY